jgi:hypothetical protein
MPYKRILFRAGDVIRFHSLQIEIGAEADDPASLLGKLSGKSPRTRFSALRHHAPFPRNRHDRGMTAT